MEESKERDIYENYKKEKLDKLKAKNRSQLTSSLDAINIDYTDISKLKPGEKSKIFVSGIYDNGSKINNKIELKPSSNVKPNIKKSYIEGEIIDVEEDREHEFKAVQESKNPPKTIKEYCKKYINAFLNTNGGILYFGVVDDGEIVGIILTDRQKNEIITDIHSIMDSYKPKVDSHLVKVKFIPVLQKEDKFDNSLKKYIIEVKILRGNAPVYLTQSDKAYIRRTGSVYKMEPSLIEIRKLRGRPIFKGTTPDIPHDFIGRDNEINMINNFLMDNRRNPIVLLHGSPMAGKSTMARRLVKLYSSMYPDEQLTINMKGFSEDYVHVVEAQTILIRSLYPILQFPASKEKVKELYEECFKDKSCILLLENIGYSDHIFNLIPSSAKEIFIIATSRKDISIDKENYLSIRLSSLSQESSISLLRRASGIDINDEDALKIVKYCGYMPLPIKLISYKFKKTRKDFDSVMSSIIKSGTITLDSINSIFDASFEHITYSEYLLILSLFPTSFDDYAASEVISENIEKTRNILKTLVESNDLEFFSDLNRYSINDLFRNYCQNKCETEMDKKSLIQYKRNFVEYFLRILKLFITLCSQRNFPKGLDLLTLDKINFEAMIKYSIDINDYDLCAMVYKEIEEMNYFFGEGEKKKWNKLLEPFRSNKDIMKRVSVYISQKK